jgi:assimilatory nitrate reductase catalytic subunit
MAQRIEQLPSALTVPERADKVRTSCAYCGFQCGIEVSGTPGGPVIAGDESFPVNRGALCIKGRTAGELLRHPDRLTTPLARNGKGELTPVSWDEALGLITSAISKTGARWGKPAVGVFGGGSLTNEKAYLLHVFGGRCHGPGVRDRPRPAVPARRHP